MRRFAYVVVLLGAYLCAGASHLCAQDEPPPGPEPIEFDPPPDSPTRGDDPELPPNPNGCCEWEWVGNAKKCTLPSRGHACP
jgi:hypothetical protein